MNIDQWVSCIIETYKITGGTFSPHEKELLLAGKPRMYRKCEGKRVLFYFSNKDF